MHSFNSTDPLFSALPNEILLSIVKLMPDLPSLDCLDHASPTVAVLFDEFAPEIFEDVMSANLPTITKHLIRGVVMVRSNSISSFSLYHFKREFTHRDYYLRRSDDAPHDTPLTATIPVTVSASVLRGPLRLATLIRHHTDACIQLMLSRCMALEPSHLLDGQTVRQEISAAKFRATVLTERQRIYLVLWRLQLSLDLKTAADYPRLTWIETDIIRMQNLQIESFWVFSQVDGGRSDQIGHMVSVIDYLRESYPQPSDRPGNATVISKLPTVKDKLRTNWPLKGVDMTFDLAKSRSPGYVFMKSWDQVFHSPMWRGETSVYRRVGLHVWDAERLEALEFMCPLRWEGDPGLRPEKALSQDDLWFTWESIRSKEDLGAANAKKINEFPARFSNIDSGFYVENESYRWPFGRARY